MRALLPNAVARVRQQAQVGALGDALSDEAFCHALVRAIGAGTELQWQSGRLRCFPTRRYREMVTGEPQHTGDPPAHPQLMQSTNTTVKLGDSLLLKVYRHLRAGVNPELEVGRHLTEAVYFKHCVPVLGAIEYQPARAAPDEEPITLALLQPFLANQGDAWHYTLDYLNRFFEGRGGAGEMPAPDAHGGYLALIDTSPCAPPSCTSPSPPRARMPPSIPNPSDRPIWPPG